MLKKSYTALLLSGVLLLAGCQPTADASVTKDPINVVIEAGKESTASKTKPAATASSSAATTAAASTKPAVTKPAVTTAAATTPVTTAAPAPVAVLPDAAFTLAASGDVLSHITNTESARQPDGSYDYLPQFKPMEGLLSSADYTLVNLESPVAGEKFGYRGFPKFNAPVNLAQTMKTIGVDMVITASNHAMDSGMDGLIVNLDNLDQIGLEHIGTYRTAEEAAKPFIKDINGIKVGFVAFTYGTNHIPVTNDFAVNLNSPKRIRAKIKEARDGGAEMIVFHVHWGKEYTEYPSVVQMDIYKVLEEEGVDIVIGSHPHRLQPMEMREIEYQGRTKTQAVIWSTGNLYQGQTKLRDYINIGSVFKLTVQRKNGVIAVTDLKYDLTYNLSWEDARGKTQYKVIPLSQMDEYKADFPGSYESMKRESEWAKETLGRPVKVIFSDGTPSKSN